MNVFNISHFLPLSEVKVGDFYTLKGVCRKHWWFMPKVIGIVADVKYNKHGEYELLLVVPFEPQNLQQWASKNVLASRGLLDETTSLLSGKLNSHLIMASAIEEDYKVPAVTSAYTCRAYGVQYLPAVGELRKISQNFRIINRSLRKIRRRELSVVRLYASSSEKSKGLFWAFNFASGQAEAKPKSEKCLVRPVVTVTVCDKKTSDL